jgi:hypothetical protein
MLPFAARGMAAPTPITTSSLFDILVAKRSIPSRNVMRAVVYTKLARASLLDRKCL